jgi:hypothetical protein
VGFCGCKHALQACDCMFLRIKLARTGLNMLTVVAVLQAYTSGAPTCGHTVTIAGSASTAYPVGSWFTPCVCWDIECTR